MLQDSLKFDSELQELYVSVCAAKNTRKRKHSNEYSSALVNCIAPDQNQTSCVPTGDCILIHHGHICASQCIYIVIILLIIFTLQVWGLALLNLIKIIASK